MPHGLVEAFKSTLEEVAQADLLLHVVDLQSPEKDACMIQVNEVLQEIGADTVPTILVYNKIDTSGQSPRFERDENGMISRIWLSAATGDGIEYLLQALEEYYQRFRQCYHLLLPVDAGRLRAAIYNRLQVESEEVQSDGSFLIELWLDDRDIAWLKKQPGFNTEALHLAGQSELAPTGSYP